jgi:hypothetical protein
VAWDGYLEMLAARGEAPLERVDLRVLDEKIVLRPRERRAISTRQDPFLEILVLHYLTRVEGKQLTGRLVKFRQLPGGNAYEAAFRERVEIPLKEEFSAAPNLLVVAALSLGGVEAAFGDGSAVLAPLPMVPLTVIAWKGDDEIEGDASMLFDSGCADILATEDLAVAGSLVAGALLRISTDQ